MFGVPTAGVTSSTSAAPVFGAAAPSLGFWPTLNQTRPPTSTGPQTTSNIFGVTGSSTTLFGVSTIPSASFGSPTTTSGVFGGNQTSSTQVTSSSFFLRPPVTSESAHGSTTFGAPSVFGTQSGSFVGGHSGGFGGGTKGGGFGGDTQGGGIGGGNVFGNAAKTIFGPGSRGVSTGTPGNLFGSTQSGAFAGTQSKSNTSGVAPRNLFASTLGKTFGSTQGNTFGGTSGNTSGSAPSSVFGAASTSAATQEGAFSFGNKQDGTDSDLMGSSSIKSAEGVQNTNISSTMPVSSFSSPLFTTSMAGQSGMTTHAIGMQAIGASSSAPSVFGTSLPTGNPVAVFGVLPGSTGSTATAGGLFSAPITSSSTFLLPSNASSSAPAVFGMLPSTAAPSAPAVFGALSVPAGGLFSAPIASSSTRFPSVFGAQTTGGGALFGRVQASSGDGGIGRVSLSGSLPAADVNPPVKDGANVTSGGGTKETVLFGKVVRGAVGGGSEILAVGGVEKGQTMQATVDSTVGRSSGAEVLRRPSSSSSSLIDRRRSSSLDELLPDSSQLQADPLIIIAKNVPDWMNTKDVISSHFSKYGTVKRIFVNTTTHSANIHFANHSSAVKAMRHGSFISDNDQPLQLFWKKAVAAVSPTAATAAGGEGGGRKARGSRSSGEINSELNNMQGNEDVSSDFLSTVQGPVPSHGLMRAKKPGSVEQAAKGRGVVTERAGNKEGGAKRRGGAGIDQSAITATGSGVTSLQSLLDERALTTSDKVRLLEARDKYIKSRLGASGKHADLATAQAVVGSCQDMCPEKERYLREERNRLSVYELLTNNTEQSGGGRSGQVVDHARAVKEYSRSSADQDMPLANELRPPAVLELTMNYLLNNIADTGGPGQWEHWFDFLWDRTRAIRKDITQQHLCDSVAVALVEKCARFHVFCAEALCDEDPSIFDQKINDENLTKCLQTLQEMYYDLGVRRGVACPREAEFRCYMLLMNLNEGDSLRKVQQLRADLRESPEVQFGVRVYSALNSNNYVRFFRLVSSATFLNACILHRYFTQIRTRALQCILATYVLPGHNGAMYPLSEVAHQLSFSDEAEAAQFCTHHGLNVVDMIYPAGEGRQLALERARFISPEVAFPLHRCVALVESKLTTSIGEAVNGGPLPPNVIRQPTSSFDESGHLIGLESDPSAGAGLGPLTRGPMASLDGAVGGITRPAAGVSEAAGGVQRQGGGKEGGDVGGEEEDREGVILPPMRSLRPTSSLTPDHTAAIAALHNNLVKDIAKDLFREVIDEFCGSLCRSTFDTVQGFLKLTTQTTNDLLNTDITLLISDLCREALEDCRCAEHERTLRERALLSVACDQTATEIINEVCSEVINAAAVDVYGACVAVLRRERMDIEAELLVDDLINDVISKDVMLVARPVYEVDVVQRLAALDECERCVVLSRIKIAFDVWKKRYNGRIKMKRAMESFPPAPSLEHWSTEFRRLLPHSRGIIERRGVSYRREERLWERGVSVSGARVRGEERWVEPEGLHLGGTAVLTVKSPERVKTDQEALKQSIDSTLRRYQKDLDWCEAPLKLVTLLNESHKGLNPDRPLFSNNSSPWSNQSHHVYWKLLVSLPQLRGGAVGGRQCGIGGGWAGDEYEACDWLKSKFRNGTVPLQSEGSQVEILSLFTAPYSSTLATLPRSTPFCLAANQSGWVSESSADRRAAGGYIGVCVVAVSGEMDEEEDAEDGRMDLLGTTCLLFVTTETNLNSESGCREERLRLISILTTSPPTPPLPISLLILQTHPPPTTALTSYVQRDVDRDVIISRLGLDSLVEQQVISSFSFRSINSSTDCIDATIQLLDSVRDLCARAPPTPPPPSLFSSPSLRDYIETGLAREFYPAVLHSQSTRRAHALPDLSPHILVHMYNKALGWLVQVATHEELRKLSWPVSQFSRASRFRYGDSSSYTEDSVDLPPSDWNSVSTLTALREAILSAALPQFDTSIERDAACKEGGVAYEEGGVSWGVACEDVWAFVYDIAVDLNVDTDVRFFSSIQLLLDRALSKYKLRLQQSRSLNFSTSSHHNRCGASYANHLPSSAHSRPSSANIQSNSNHFPPSSAHIPWTDVILACIDYKLSHVVMLFDQSRNENGGQDSRIFYLEEMLEQGPRLSRWIQFEDELLIGSETDKSRALPYMIRSKPDQSRASSSLIRPDINQSHASSSLIRSTSKRKLDDSQISPDKNHYSYNKISSRTLRDKSQVLTSRDASLDMTHDIVTSSLHETVLQDDVIVQLRELLHAEKKESKDFDEFLRRALDSSDTSLPAASSPLTLSKPPTPPPPSPLLNSSGCADLDMEDKEEEEDGPATIASENWLESFLSMERSDWSIDEKLSALSQSVVREQSASKLCELKLEQHLYNLEDSFTAIS